MYYIMFPIPPRGSLKLNKNFETLKLMPTPNRSVMTYIRHRNLHAHKLSGIFIKSVLYENPVPVIFSNIQIKKHGYKHCK